jgi:hypothetical protein
MMENQPQSLANHAMYDPKYHFVLAPIALLNVFFTLYQMVRGFSLGSLWTFIMSIGFMAAVLCIRGFPLGVQNRVIRLEERIRLSQLLPEPLRSRIGDLTTDQLIGLRFASDGELPGLVKRALDEKLSRKAIKQEIKQWRPDYERV